MAALTSARNTPEMADGGRVAVYPVEANTKIYLGSMVALNAAGNAAPAATATGLKVIGRAEAKKLLREERERGTTVLLSSHALAETETICDRFGIMNEGRLLETAIPGLLSSGVREWEIVVESMPPRMSESLRAAGHRVEPVGGRWVVGVRDGAALQEALAGLTQDSVFVHSVEPRRETLEEHFVRALNGAGGGPS